MAWVIRFVLVGFHLQVDVVRPGIPGEDRVTARPPPGSAPHTRRAAADLPRARLPATGAADRRRTPTAVAPMRAVRSCPRW